MDKSNGLELEKGKEKAKGDDRFSLVIFENDGNTRRIILLFFSVDDNRWSMGAAVAAERENFDALLSRVI